MTESVLIILGVGFWGMGLWCKYFGPWAALSFMVTVIIFCIGLFYPTNFVVPLLAIGMLATLILTIWSPGKVGKNERRKHMVEKDEEEVRQYGTIESQKKKNKK